MAVIMSASKLATWLSKVTSNEPVPAFVANHTVFRRIGIEPRSERCPACDSIIYSRRHDRCGVCEKLLPESCLLSSAEAERVNLLLKTERERHRAWLIRTDGGEL
jgi:hypothetical protein